MNTSGFLSDISARVWLRLQTLILLRSIAISGQLSVVGISYLYLNVQMNYVASFLIIGSWALLNLAQFFYRRKLNYPSADWVFILLFVDLIELAALLFFTGGIHNPFASLLVVPVILGAAALSNGALGVLWFFATMAVVALYFVAPPILQNGTLLVMSPLVHFGHMIAVLVTMIFLSFFIRRMTRENASMNAALGAAELALSREQGLSELGGLAAAYAHELGTPLATIRLVSGELLSETLAEPIQEDVALISSETKRCSDILSGMGQRGREDILIKELPFLVMVEAAVEPHADRGIFIDIRVNGKTGGVSPIVIRSAAIVHGLRNVVQNSVDFAQSTVTIDINHDEKVLEVVVVDDGYGYSSTVLSKIGEPFVRTREFSGGDSYQGMGLGLFISRTLIERTGAQMNFSNHSVMGGAQVSIKWPLADISIGSFASRRSLGENPRRL